MVEHGFEAMQTIGPARDLLNIETGEVVRSAEIGTVEHRVAPRRWVVPADAYARDDESPDEGSCHGFPRKVVHAHRRRGHRRAGALCAEVLPPGRLLDLMSSWRSHLPARAQPR